MASTGGVTGPVPPKRPTVIRSNHGSPPVPSRPAPPTPGRKIDSNTDDEQKQLPPPPPARPVIKSRPSSVINTTQPSSMSSTSNGGKRRPEITIVSARPMSEIGFRGVPAMESKQLEDKDTKSGDHIESAPPPVPSTRPHVKPSESLDHKPDRIPPRPPVIRPTVPPITSKPDLALTTEDTKQPVRAPPPPIPRLPPSPMLKRSGDDPQKSTTVLNVAPVPIPRNTAKHEPSYDGVVDDLIDISTDGQSESTTSEAMYSVINKPKRPTIIRPNRPPVRDKSPHVADDSSSSNIPIVPPKVLPTPSPEQIHIQTDEGQDTADGDLLQARKSLFENKQENNLPEFLTKRLKSTIPVENDINEAQQPKPSKKPLPPPTKPKPNIPSQVKPPPPPKPKSTLSNESHEVDKKSVSDIFNKPPSPMLKPKPSSPVKTDTDHQESQPSPENKPPPPPAKLKPTIFSQFDKSDQEERSQNFNKPNIPTTKPKPTIIPKPQVSTKPQPLKLQNESEHSESLRNTADNVTDVKSEIDDSNNKPVKGNETNETVKSSSVKRPTIIRPLKGVQSKSSENVNQEDQLSTNPKTDLQPLDDHVNRTSSRPLPALPNKRPVSMINIPDALAQEEKDKSMSRGNHFVTQSTENISQVPSSPKPVPRPAARPRPASMMLPQAGRPPLPSSGPKVQSADTESHSPPQRPPHRPPGSRMSSIGIPVLPRLDNDITKEVESSGPVKPPPPLKMSKDEKDSSSDEEFYTAQTKPDRPTGPPKPRPRTHSDDMPISDTSPDKKPPPRPTGAPPPGRKTSINTEKEETHTSTIKGKPERPVSKPSRPISTPPKMDQPMRPQPPRPGGNKTTRRTNGPTLPSRPGPNHPLYSYMMKAPHGIAVFDYNARQEDELQFKTGDVIILKKIVDADWLFGEMGENEGMFPKSFVKVKIPLPGQEADSGDSSDEDEEIYFDATAEKPDTIGVGPRCRARFDFDGEGADDLPFEEGDMIKLLERVGPEWRKGECNGMIGVFPLVFVELIEDLAEDTGPNNKGTTVKAMFDFEGEANELSFQAGENIQVQYMVNEEWLYGVIGERSGQFPVQFIDHVPPELPPMPQTELGEVNTVDPLTASLAMWDTEGETRNQPISTKEIQQDSPKSQNVFDTHEGTHKQFGDSLMKEWPSEQESLSGQGDDDQPYCVALYDYPGETADDLKFDTGDRIDLLERVNSDWLKGTCNGKTGIFPSAFVQIEKDFKEDSSTFNEQLSHPNSTELDSLSSSPHTEIGVAQYDFAGESENELTFTVGDKIQLLEHVPGAEDWRYGILNGRRGIFPAAFVISES